MSAADATAVPARHQREEAVDALRGFALLGILVVNAGAFSSTYYGTGLSDPLHSQVLDRWVRAMVTIGFETKFYLLFSFLFGYSFVLQVDSAQRAGTAFVPRFVRRLGGLALLGLAHGWLLFAGDILLTYALLGAVLLLLRGLPPRRALLLAGGLVVCTAGGWAALAWLESMAPTPWDVATIHAQAQQAALAYRHGALESIAQRGRDMAQGMWFVLVFIQAPCALAMFLVGMVAARQAAMTRWMARPRLLQSAMVWCIPAGLAGGVCMAWVQGGGAAMPQYAAMAAMALNLLTAPALVAGYVAALLWVFLQPLGRIGLALLAPAGRMALSNYLLQSLVGAMVFTAYGARLVGQVSPAVVLLGCAALYAAQLAWSRRWLSAHAYGPAEWLLRAITLWHWPAWRVR